MVHAYESAGQRWTRYALWIYVTLVLVFLMAPLLVIVPLSFSAGSFLYFPLPGLSLRWYADFFTSDLWLRSLRNSLMVIQFVLSGLLIICTTIVWQQLNYMRTAPLGYNKQQVLSIPIGAHIDGQRALDLIGAVRTLADTNPEVELATSAADVPVRFTTVGTYNYHCTLHPNETGSIVVTQ